MRVPESPYELLKESINLDELSPGSVVALARNINRATEAGKRTEQESGTPFDEHLGVFDELWTSLSDLPEKNPPHARAVVRAFVESPLVEDRAFGATLIHKLTRNDHDFGYGLWQRLARDPALEVRHEATYVLQDCIHQGQIRPERQQDFSFQGLTLQDAANLIHLAEQVSKGELPPFDLGQETLAIALGHTALPTWAQPPA